MKKKDRNLPKAIEEVFSNPNLPLYIYFSNFNFLIGDEFMKIGKNKKEKNVVWKQKVHSFKKFDMLNPSSQFQELRKRVDENPNHKALWKLDLRRYFDKNNEDDIKNLIIKRFKKNEEFKKIEKTTKNLVDRHTNMMFHKSKQSKKHSLLKGPPLFFDEKGELSDGLVEFHNTMNKNLFNKKNFLIMKKFYTTRDFYKPGQGIEENPQKNKPINHSKLAVGEEIGEDNVLGEDQIDYLLEQRAYAIKNFNKNISKVNSSIPLKPKFKINKLKIPGASRTGGFTYSSQKLAHSGRTPIQSVLNRTSNSGATTFRVKSVKSIKQKPNIIPMELKSVKSSKKAPSLFGNLTPTANFEFEEKDVANMKSVLEKIENLAETCKGAEFDQKATLISKMYQRLKKNHISPENNFFENFKDKYSEVENNIELDEFKQGLRLTYREHMKGLDQLIQEGKKYDIGEGEGQKQMINNSYSSITSSSSF